MLFSILRWSRMGSKKKDNQSVFRFAHFAMGTTFEVVTSGEEKTYASQASQEVFNKIDRIESLFSCFNPCSDIGQINRLKPGQSLRVGVETYECLKTASQIHSLTSGAFDVNIGSLAKPGKIANPKLEKMNPGRRQLQLDSSKSIGGFIVRIPEEQQSEYDVYGINLDLGGIGKGYALDKSINILSDWSINNALIHGGTSTALAVGTALDGNSNKKGWPVGISGDWECHRVPKKFYLRNRALSSSGTEVKGEHIINPKTGAAAKENLAAWVSHPSATVADALSTAFMVMSTEEIKAFCDNNPEIWALIIIDSNSYKTFNVDYL